ncbi:MAG: DUF748 domain-containing protein [Chitinophagales bacterium]|nr:DUF748 domain-containing protein [Chitinophagales bacterium]
MKQNSNPANKHAKRGRLLRILLIIVVVLIVIRLVLPYVVLHYANKTLANMKGYYGHIEDIDLALYRGAYKVKDIYLNKVDSTSGKESKFFDSKVIDLSLEWKALFHGSVVGDLLFENPHLRIIKERVEPKQLAEDTTDFKDLLDKFMPIKINRFEIRNGVLQYIDNTSSPNVDVSLKRTNVVATNLTNAFDSTEILPSSIAMDADIYEGAFKLNMKLNPLAERPTFDMNARLDNTNLVLLNDFLSAYAKVDVNKGTFGLYTEIASKQGKFIGYVKPVIKDLNVVGAEDRNDSFFHKLWEGVVGTVADILTNQPKDQFATKIPLEGDLSEPDAKIWTAIIEVLRNAFVQALFPAIDQEINLAAINKKEDKDKSTLEKIFDKDKPVEKDKKDDKKDKKQDKKEKNDKEKIKNKYSLF